MSTTYGSVDIENGSVASTVNPSHRKDERAGDGDITNARVKLSSMETLRYLEADMRYEKAMHLLASSHFKVLYDWFLFLPSILLSLVGGILSLSANGSSSPGGADGVSTASSSGVAIGVGIISLISVFWQSLTKQLDFGARARLHESAALSLKKLIDDLPFKQLDPDLTEKDLQAYLKEVNEKFRLALDGCDSSIPIRLTSAFYSCRSELDLHLDIHHSSVFEQFGLTRQSLYITAIAEMFMTFSNYPFFPFMLPSPGYAVTTAMQSMHEKFLNAKDEHP